MFNFLKSILKPASDRNRECSQGEMIERLLGERKKFLGDAPVFVETGCGISTISLGKCAKRLNALVYSLDYNSEKCATLQSKAGDLVSNIAFVIGDTVENLPKIVAKHEIDFVFLDSAASAMHTFREFLACEPALKPGACLLVDNAALPDEKMLLSPVRKGKILVHYLLASPYWEVRGHPRSGDSMISAILHKEADFADPDYEHPEYTDMWRQCFGKAL